MNYLSYEHAHTEWPDDKLFEEITTVDENMCNVQYTGERLEVMRRRMALAVFEQNQRSV